MNFGIICIILAAAFWGMGGVSGQYLFTYHQVDPIWLVMIRQLCAGILFLGYAALVQKEDIFAILKKKPVDVLKFSFLGVLGAQFGYYYTISLCNAATGTILQYSAPIIVMVWVSYKARRMPDGRELLGLFLALVGIFLISTHGNIHSLAISPLALVTGIFSAFAYAYYTVMPVELLKTYKTTVLIGWGQLLSGLPLMLYQTPWSPSGSWDTSAYIALTYLVFGSTIASYGLYLTGLKVVGPTKASLVSCAEPLASIIFVVLLLGTVLTLEDYIGMACIIFTVLIISLPKK